MNELQLIGAFLLAYVVLGTIAAEIKGRWQRRKDRKKESSEQ